MQVGYFVVSPWVKKGIFVVENEKEIYNLVVSELKENGLETFDSIAAMDNAIYLHIDRIKNIVPKSAIKLLLKIGSHSLLAVGLSWCKQSTLAKELGVSRQTINALIKKLKELGVIRSFMTITKSRNRRSVNLLAIQPFDNNGFTSEEAGEASKDEGLKVKIENEPFKQNHLKQEKNNKKAVQGNIDKILSFFKMKLNDRIKNGDNIEHLSSYAERVLRHEERKAAIKKQQQQARKAKEEKQKLLLDNIAVKYFGERFEDLGQMLKNECLSIVDNMEKPKQQPIIPFFNWLEA